MSASPFAVQDIPEEMQLRLREYFVQSKHLQIAQSHNNLLELMSPMLQGEVVWQVRLSDHPSAALPQNPNPPPTHTRPA